MAVAKEVVGTVSADDERDRQRPLRNAVGADSLSYSLSVLVLGYAAAAIAFGLARETGVAPGAVRT